MEKTEQPQAVTVTNFPKKDIWDKLMIAVTILSLVVAIGSLFLYWQEITKKSDMYLDFYSPSPTLGTVPLTFESGQNYSVPFELDVLLANHGNLKSDSSGLTLWFSRLVNVSLADYSRWGGSSPSNNMFRYGANNSAVSFKPKEGENIGTFYISLPQSENGRLLMASFVLSGDSNSKYGLVYFNYQNRRFDVEYSSPENMTQIWNQNSLEINKQLPN